MKRTKVLAVAAMALAVTIGGGAWLNLQAQAAESTADQTQTNGTAAADSTCVKKGPGMGGEFHGGPGGKHGGKHGGPEGRFMVKPEELATLLGVTADELKAALDSGKTLAALAAEKGVDVQTVIDQAVKGLTAELDQKLADGKLTQEQYDQHKANLTDKVTKFVNGELGPKGAFDEKLGDKHGGPGGHFPVKPEELASLLGVTADELKAALDSGKTLAALAAEKGVDVQTVIDQAVKGLTAELDQKLADGKLTQEQYDQHKANLTDKVTKFVNGELGPKGGFKEKRGKETGTTE